MQPAAKEFYRPIQYQDLFTQDGDLPLHVSYRRSSSQSGGCALHWHEALEFYYVAKGGVSLLHNGKIHWLNPGDVGFLNWCEPHRGNGFLDGTEHYIIQIGTELFAEEQISWSGEAGSERKNLLMLLIAQKNRIPSVFRECKELNGLLDALIREVTEKQTGYTLKIRAIVWDILIFLLRQAEQNPGPAPGSGKDQPGLEHLKKVLAFLSVHYMDPEAVSLPALSRRFGLSVPYLCRLFKRYTTLTVTAYVNELRCSRAAAFIQDGMQLEEAAKQTGFRDYNYFSRLFKKVMGMPPSTFRKRES